MDPRHRISDTSGVITPALIVFHEILEENIDRMLRLAGGAQRLRPHCKTHKMKEVVRLLLDRGVARHKAATLAECEMLVEAGARDVLLSYPCVGPNIGRAVKFLHTFPDVAFSVIVDHPRPVAELGEAMAKAGRELPVLLDLDTGLHRTGIAVGPAARALYAKIARTPGLVPAGLHVYDGQNHQVDPEQRRRAVLDVWEAVAGLRDGLVREGYSVPRIVAGATGSFPVFAGVGDPSVEVCPGTCIFHDRGYDALFGDLGFRFAALLLTRVISCPGGDYVTLDLGYKAVASDAPAEKRIAFPEIPDARVVLQNEEHLVIRTSRAGDLGPGDALLAIPWHACPTSALHRQAVVVRKGEVAERWEVAARDRWLTI